MKKRRNNAAPATAFSGPGPRSTEQRLRRRLLFQIGAALFLISVAVAGLLAWGTRPRTLTEPERAALIEYEKIRLALADDDLEAAVRSARSLRAGFPQLPISNQAPALEKSDSLETARHIFKEMSQDAIRLVRGVDGYFVAECPPGNECPVKCSPCRMSEFGPWVQISRELQNPFMGRKSPRCGVLRRS